jgi:hypothetical protein
MIDIITASVVTYAICGAVVAAVTGQFAARHWLLQLFIALDQLLNVLVTPFHAGAWSDETLSARSYRAQQAGRLWGRVMTPVIDAIFYPFQGPRHCQMAFEKERQRVHSPPEQRNSTGA